MALLNKIQARALVRELIDDPAGKLWSTPNLDLLIEGSIDDLWGELLDAFPWLRSTETTVTPTAPGYVLWDSTSTTIIRPYRVQQVIRSSQIYHWIDPKDVAVAAGVVLYAPDATWTFLGNQLHAFPYSTSALTVRYNTRPEPFTSITPGPLPDSDEDDIAFVEWPDGHHLAYVYDVASKALEKGDREDSARLGRRAEQAMFRLRAFLRKQQIGGIMPWTSDDSLSWGSVT